MVIAYEAFDQLQNNLLASENMPASSRHFRGSLYHFSPCIGLTSVAMFSFDAGHHDVYADRVRPKPHLENNNHYQTDFNRLDL